jgi:hypothetical protein|tara:strand:- start:43599 stop:43793 length:195 start_codon:yes stop_codon:yes gene_type:complete
MVNKKINLDLIGLNDNAFALMRAFSKQAKRENWNSKEIDEVLNKCKSGDYNHLLNTLMDYWEVL